MKNIKYLVLIFLYLAVIGALKIDQIISNDEEHENTELFTYLDKLGERESGGDYTAVNSFGYMGKYQFSRTTLNGLGLFISKNEFLNNPTVQDSMVIELLLHNRQLMGSYIQKYDGTEVKGRLVTESGILAAAHLIGPQRTKLYLDMGIDTKDGYGTPVSAYIHQFSGYKLSLN
jgi:hypothetical protein